MKALLLVFFTTLLWLQTNAQTKLIVTYDNSGNQLTREYCDGCTNRTASQTKEVDSLTTVIKEIPESTANLDQRIEVLPNPTYGEVTLSWDTEIAAQIRHIKIVGYHTPYQKNIPYSQEQQTISIDLSKEPSSIYIVQFWMTDGSLITKKIIKK
ncbi:hypothetical protein ACJD0Z_17495 [Flavobacteriaceae bacterium M23B6Z8]